MNASVKKTRDWWIALRCQHGEPEAFGDLVREMERPLLYFAQKLLNDQDKALDVLQEVWLKAFQTIRRLENPRLVRAWLYRLTRGLAIDRVRKEALQRRADALALEHLFPAPAGARRDKGVRGTCKRRPNVDHAGDASSSLSTNSRERSIVVNGFYRVQSRSASIRQTLRNGTI